MTHPISSDLLERPDIGIRLYLMVEGIPYVFLDGSTPIGPDGTAWTAPIDPASSGSYTLLEDSFDTAAVPFRDSGVKVVRSESDVSPAQVRLLLRDHDDTLLALFGRHRTDVAVGTLAASIGHHDTTLSLEDATGWTVGDLLYLGRETMLVDAITGDDLTVTRGCYAMSGSTTRYTLRDLRPTAPRTCAGAPRVWLGRYVRVVAYAVNLATGRALQSGLGLAHEPFVSPGPTYEWEVWRGLLDRSPRVTGDWSSWELSADGLESVMRTEVGYESATASMLRVAAWQDTLAANRAGAFEAPPSAPAGLTAGFWVSRDNTRVAVTVTQWASAADRDSDTSPTTWTYTGADALVVYDTDGGLVTRSALLAAFSAAVSDTLRTDTGLGSVSLLQGGSGAWYSLKVSSQDTTAHRVTFGWDGEESIGQLLGLSGASAVDVCSSSVTVQPQVTADGGGYAVSIPPTAASIPFWYDAEEQMREPPASGYAVIGDDDDHEIVRYSAIAAFGAAEHAGVYMLTGVTRGCAGTVPRWFRVSQEQAVAGAEKVKIRFGVGWESTSVADIILQLLCSQDGSETVSDYDLLPAGVTPAMNASHVDVQSFVSMGQQLAAWERARTIVLTKSIRLGELIGRLLQPLGWWVSAATVYDGTYRLQARQALPALDSQVRLELDERHLVADASPDMDESGTLANYVRLTYGWNPATHEFRKGAYVEVIDDDSEAEHGQRAKVEWQLLGVTGIDAGTAYTTALHWAFGMFARFGRPYDVLRCEIGRVGWLLSPGDTVDVTIAGMPTTFGERGVSRSAVVMQASKAYSGSRPTVQLRLALEAPARHTTYAPAARVATWDGSTGVTLTPTAFSAAGDYDYAHFRAGDVVWVYKLDYDASTRVTRTISTISGSSVTFTAALPGTFAAGADSLVTFADYGSCTARQRAFAFLADATPALGASPTDPVLYV